MRLGQIIEQKGIVIRGNVIVGKERDIATILKTKIKSHSQARHTATARAVAEQVKPVVHTTSPGLTATRARILQRLQESKLAENTSFASHMAHDPAIVQYTKPRAMYDGIITSK